MKFLIAITLAAAAACAAPQTHVNVAAVRHDIKDVIDRDRANPRTIVSMGHTTADSAVVYTQAVAAPRHEESWIRGASGWALAGSKDVTASAN